MEYTIEPTDIEVKLDTDDLSGIDVNIAYRRGYGAGRLSAKDLYGALRGLVEHYDIILVGDDLDCHIKAVEALAEGGK